jgi:hypothetical protein
MISKKEISKSIEFFHYEKINYQIIDELIKFIKSNPKDKKSRYTDGTNILIDNIKIKIVNNEPKSLSIGINNMQVRDFEISPNLYYYFRGGEIVSTDNPDSLTFW